MAQLTDTYIPDYAYNVPVTSGNTWYGPLVPMYGSLGYSLQVVLTNGAAGNFAWCPTNMASVPALYNQNNGALPPFGSAGTASISANGNYSNAMTVNNVQVYYQSIYFYFSPTASGNLYIAVNVRRTNN